MVEETIFDKIISGEIPSTKIYEDENFLAFLDIKPFEKGHTLVIPKKRFDNIFQIPEFDFLELQKVVYKIANSYQQKLNCGITILQNNISEQQIPWIHFHIIPRQLDGKVLDKMENRWHYESIDEMKIYQEKLKLN